MTEYQERRLQSLHHRIEFQENHKRFFKRNYKTIIISALFGSAGIVGLGFINDPKRIEFPETYDYSELYFLAFKIFLGVLIMILVVHIIMNLQSNYIIKQLEKEEKLILETIEKNNMEFERFEDYDEIEKEN